MTTLTRTEVAFRFIEVFVPVEQGARLQEILSKHRVVAHWTEAVVLVLRKGN